MQTIIKKNMPPVNFETKWTQFDFVTNNDQYFSAAYLSDHPEKADDINHWEFTKMYERAFEREDMVEELMVDCYKKFLLDNR
jgi:TPP-dependent 2-oxoacid decarboxylase